MRKAILKSKEEMIEFIQDHAGEISGLVRDRFYRWGGNGYMMSLGEVQKRYGVEFDTEALSEVENSEVDDELRRI